MSAEGTTITTRHFEYVRARTIPEDGFLSDLKREAAAAGLPAIWISPEQGAFMRILLELIRAREVVEVGTLAGYSAIHMARALPPTGRVRTIEIDSVHADFAERWIEKSDVAGRIEVHRGDAREVLPTFETASADAAFIDADKVGYRDYLDQSLRIVRLGGLLLADNAFAFGQLFADQPSETGVAAVRAFNDHVAGVACLSSVITPIGDGLWVCVKTAEPA